MGDRGSWVSARSMIQSRVDDFPERRDERFDGDVEGSELTIWIPVRK